MQLVGAGRLELPSLAKCGSETHAYTNSATHPIVGILVFCLSKRKPCYHGHMTWQAFAVSVPLLFVAYQALSKLLPESTSAFLVNAYASAIGAFIMLALYVLTSSQKSFVLDARTLSIALGIGVLISIGNAGIIHAYLLGAPQSSFSAIYYPLLVIYALIVSVIIWHERLNVYQILGIALCIVGILLIVYFKR